MARKTRVVIKPYVVPLIGEAIKIVSNGHRYVFDIRTLFYKVRELFLKEYYRCPECNGKIIEVRLGVEILAICDQGHEVCPDELTPVVEGLKFYDYNSFTQDFMVWYEKEYGKIELMYRHERGRYCYPTSGGWSYENPIGGKEEAHPHTGIANKVIIVEKEGIYGILKENDFDVRLDAVIVSTMGHSIEEARKLLKKYQQISKVICILHDLDIHGLEIAEELTRPTKRRDIHLDAVKVVDLGINFEIVRRLGLLPEPVKLSKQDLGKLNGLLERGVIDKEQYEFLKSYRVEINALTPSQLVQWLEERLKELDLWKTIPSQEEIDETIEREVKSEVNDEVEDEGMEFVGVGEVRGKLDEIEGKIGELASKLVADITVEHDYTPDDVRKALEKNNKRYWTRVVKAWGSRLAREMNIDDAKEDIKDKLYTISEMMDEVIEKLDEVLEEMETIE